MKKAYLNKTKNSDKRIDFSFPSLLLLAHLINKELFENLQICNVIIKSNLIRTMRILYFIICEKSTMSTIYYLDSSLLLTEF